MGVLEVMAAGQQTIRYSHHLNQATALGEEVEGTSCGLRVDKQSLRGLLTVRHSHVLRQVHCQIPDCGRCSRGCPCFEDAAETGRGNKYRFMAVNSYYPNNHINTYLNRSLNYLL